MRLIDADALYEKIKSDEELARDRVIDTPNSFPNGAINPSAIRYMARLNERTRFKEMVYDAPTIEPQRWILCTDRLPEDERTVWVTVKGHDVIIVEDGETLEEAVDRVMKIRWVTQGYYCREEGEEGWNDPMFGTPLMVQPIAWMDIDKPEPWEGEHE